MIHILKEKSLYIFILVFIALLPISFTLELISKYFIKNEIIAFLSYHSFLIPFLSTKKEICWYLLTIFHGHAHLMFPSSINNTINKDFDPVYDYSVHALQCLFVLAYHPKLFLFGIIEALGLIVGSLIAHFRREFLESYMFIILSGGGFFGTQYHMMLINNKKDKSIFVASFFIWCFSYIGYIVPGQVHEWDFVMYNSGLFSFWFFNYFMTSKVYDMISSGNNSIVINETKGYSEKCLATS
jgi:hypothetical protein